MHRYLEQANAVAEQPRYQLIASSREHINLVDFASLTRVVTSAKPECIINCARSFDSHWPDMYRVNAAMPGRLAWLCGEFGIDLIHVSCGRVLADCPIPGPLSEHVSVAPPPDDRLAISSASGEQAVIGVAGSNPYFNCWVLRCPWLFGGRLLRPARDVLGRARENLLTASSVFVPSDTRPTSVCDINLLCELIQLLVDEGASWANDGPVFPTGVYHVANTGQASLAQIALRMAQIMQQPSTRIKTLDASPDYPLLPVLDTDKLQERFGPAGVSWEDALERWLT